MSEALKLESTALPSSRVIPAADADRGMFNPRGTIAGENKLGKMVIAGLVGVGFVAVVAIGALNGGAKPKDPQALDKDAAVTANQAARTVAIDPLGNRPIPVAGSPPVVPGGEDLSQAPVGGQIVPSIGDQTGRGAATSQMSPAQLRQQRVAEDRAKRQARLEAQRRAPLLAVVVPRDAGAQGARPRQGPVLPEVPAERSPLEARLVTTEIPTVRPGALANPNFLITAGTQIPCVLQTAMDSTLPGLTSCIVPRSVFSDNGRVVLMEKGTKVLGEFQGGLQQGQNRIFIVWNRAVTPRGVAIDLGSPAADALGRTGLGGRVETFFLKRFGGALLLSIVGDLGSVASDRLSGANETSRAPSQAAGIALQNDLKIQPRLRAAQGSETTIFVARDVDFSKIYSLRLKR